MEPSIRYPIAVMSFDRPHYLESVLRSLSAQTVPIAATEIFLFQDGYRSRNGQDLTDPRRVERCMELFETIFPGSRTFPSAENLGVAFNFARAENYFFEELGVEAAFFFEDDLVLSQHYLTPLYALTAIALEEKRIAYVAAYGDHRVSLAEQKLSAKKLILMRHKWGFALTRRQWLAQRDILAPYVEILARSDYRSRDHVAIRQYFNKLGFGSNGTSQDAMKDVASCVLGTVKIMSAACFGKYIGEVGLHSNSRLYQNERYAQTSMFSEEISSFGTPSSAMLDEWVDITRSEGAKTLRSIKFDNIGPTPTQAAVRLPQDSFSRDLLMSNDLNYSWQNAEFDQQWKIAKPQLEKMRRGDSVDVFDSFIAIMEYIPKLKRYSFLDCACALGYYYDVLKHRTDHEIDYTGTDFAESAVARAKARHPGVTWKNENLTALSFADLAFEIVLASGVLEHVPAWELALLNITRVASLYVILHRLPISRTGSFTPRVNQQYGIETARNSFSFHQVVLFMASRDFAIVNSLDTYGTYNIPEQTMLFRRIAA